MKRDEQEISVVIVHETERALLVTDSDTDGSLEVWLPKSQVSNLERTKQKTKRGFVANITIPEWLGKKHDLI